MPVAAAVEVAAPVGGVPLPALMAEMLPSSVLALLERRATPPTTTGGEPPLPVEIVGLIPPAPPMPVPHRELFPLDALPASLKRGLGWVVVLAAGERVTKRKPRQYTRIADMPTSMLARAIRERETWVNP